MLIGDKDLVHPYFVPLKLSCQVNAQLERWLRSCYSKLASQDLKVNFEFEKGVGITANSKWLTNSYSYQLQATNTEYATLRIINFLKPNICTYQ